MQKVSRRFAALLFPSPSVRKAKEKARAKLAKHAVANPVSIVGLDLTSSIVEPSSLACYAARDLKSAS